MIAMEANGDVAAACSRRPPRRARVGLVLAFAVAPALEVLEDTRKLRATKSFKIFENSPGRLGNFGPAVRRHPPHCNLQMLNCSAS